MDLRLKGKKAIVTGATRGIGLSIARTMAAEGVDVAICSRTKSQVDDTIDDLNAMGVKAIGDEIDVTDREVYIDWLNSVATRLGGVDIFVSNVSGFGMGVGETPWHENFDADVLSAVRGCETLLPYLRKSEATAVVLIASVSAVNAKSESNWYAYGACKAALISYGAQLSRDMAKEGIRVNTVSPGPILFEGGAWDDARETQPDVFKSWEAQCAIGRMGTPEEVASAVAFLASSLSSNTVGQNLCVDGGFTSHVDY